MLKLIEEFLNSPTHALAGTSVKEEKYGNKILKAYIEKKYEIYPIHPAIKEIEGLTTYKDVTSLPNSVKSLSLVTPPAITEKLVIQAKNKGIKNIWMQPGAQSQTAVDFCKNNDINVIYGGECVLVILNKIQLAEEN